MKNTIKTLVALIVAVASLVALRAIVTAQSLTYTKGQNVAPAYEGWEQDADGTKYFVFGYMNRNWVEEPDLPIGADNSFSPGTPDLGQPTHFLPRRNRFVFRVPVPKTFTEKDELLWTLTSHGVTEKAYGSTRADYLLDDVVKASETGALGAGTSSPEVRSNKPPVVKVEGPKALTAKVGQLLKITTLVTDDGIPKPRLVNPAIAAIFGGTAAPTPGAAGAPGAPGAGRGAAGDPFAAVAGIAAAAAAAGLSPEQVQQVIAARRNPSMQPPVRVTVGKVTGLHLSWFVYRGAGKVHFSPDQVQPWEDTRAGSNSPWSPLWTPPVLPADGRVPVDITFDAPGTYVLRTLADDGALFGGENITVTVTP